MHESVSTAAHVTHFDEADATALVRLRESLLPEAESRGIKLTYLPLVVKAVVEAMKAHPYLNSSLDDEDEEIILKKYYNIGIAVDVPDGLIVPVVKAADQKTALDLAGEIAGLAKAARERTLDLADLKGGTFSITNVGVLGGDAATPIINYPEAAILATMRIADRVRAAEGKIVVRKTLPLCLSFDHRIIDGAAAARFVTDLKKILEDPQALKRAADSTEDEGGGTPSARALPSFRTGVARRHVIQRRLLHLPDLVDDVLEVRFPGQVQVVGFDDEERGRLVVEEKVIERLDQVLEILLGDVPFDGAALLGQPAQQRRQGDLEVDDEVGLGDALGEDAVDLVVDDELVVRERLVGEDLVLLEDVVAEDPLFEELALDEPDLLVVAVDQEDELGEEGRALLLVVEVLEVGVLRPVVDDLPPEALGEQGGELRLAGLHHPLDGEVPEVRERGGIGHGRSSRLFISDYPEVSVSDPAKC